MTLSDDRVCGRSQLLTQSRSKSSIGWMDLARYVQSPAILANRPKPDFVIGTKVSDRWLDEFGKDYTEFGVVVGICWHPRKNTWAYLIDWYKGEGPDSLYPCFDGNLVIDGDLRRSND